MSRLLKLGGLFGAFGVATVFSLYLSKGNGLWNGLAPASAGTTGQHTSGNYDLTQLKVVNEVLDTVRNRYVDPKRVKPKEMLLSALNFVQRDVAQVIVLHEEGSPTVKIRVDTQEKEFKVDNVLGPWDVSSHLREIFQFIQDGLRGTEVDLREVEYAACNGMLHTLDPHSVLLSPEAYKEMNLSTSGQFGGLGIVISLRDQQLTVINPMPGTPAAKAGIKKYDRIVKINNEATLNMGLNEAVNHLRGTPGTKVTVWVHRDGDAGWQGVKPFELQREVIKVASVESKLLEGNIGYVRLKQFQQNTSADLDAALSNMKKEGELKGLVLDLRGNPGGLLEQAARVSDKFITSGPLVATVGNDPKDREEKSARAEGTEPNYPIVLLVSGTSASASEIVAGALKNHDRAVIVGETTFGKGSVQLIFNELPDKAALKLTIAQYLTEPGDISIQGTGIAPDIELDPMTADLQEMDLTVDSGMVKERDLAKSLSNSRIKEGQKPLETVRYNLPDALRRELRERGGDPDEVLGADFPNKDFPVKFAKELVAKLPQGKRLDQVRAAKEIIAQARSQELAKASQDLSSLGIDWSDAPAAVAPSSEVPSGLEVKLETDKPNNEVVAGQQISLKLTMTNKSNVPLYRLNAVTKSDSGLFDNKELVIGKLEPGKTKTATIPLGWCDVEGRKPGQTAPLPKDAPRVCKVPKDTFSRTDGIKLHFEEAKGRAPADVETRVTVKALDRPVFSYSYQIVDNRKGNGDGRVQKGENLTMFVAVKNTGKGPSYETQANLRNLSGDGVLLHEGRYDLSNMKPGETRKVAFTFDVESQLADAEAKVELSITDRDLRETVVEKVRMPIVAQTPITASTGSFHAKANGAALFEAPDVGSRSFGKLASGVAANAVATAGEFTKLTIGDGRFAFAKTADLDAGGTSGATVAFDDAMQHLPPSIEFATPPLVVREGKITLKGTAQDTERLLDAYIFVGGKKVFYRSNRNGADAKKMPFEADIPLRPGVNAITVVARENADSVGRKTIVVRRDGPNGELLASPKTEEDDGDSSSDD